jgi:type 1 glutamine amidotransferase
MKKSPFHSRPIATVRLAMVLGLTAVTIAAMAPAEPRLLVFSKTAGFRHGSIEPGVAALESLAAGNGMTVTASEDSAVFTDESLASYDAVIFLSTTGDILDEAEQAALERYIRAGRGFVGIHAASDTEYDWPWYGGLVGGYFASHPAIQEARIEVVDHGHPSTAHLGAEWIRTDEWYDLRSVADHIQVLMMLDESSYEGGGMGESHPIAWYHEYDGGRAFYTALGHTEASYTEPDFLAHVLGGIQYALGETP